MAAQIISFRCTLRSRTGQLISSSVSRDVLTDVPGQEGPLPGLARKLVDLKEGELREIIVPAQDAYGYYDPEKLITIPRHDDARAPLHIGDTVSVVDRDGVAGNYRVARILGDAIELDGNHPLAGQDLAFEIEAFEVRDATAEEIEESRNTPEKTGLH
ncbi:MAG: FKBP-type peptidyl-prolyl cis-trans isomerase [Bdellovibrionaceae bacterium]|nr:FKBP-type peptidyl-prolyl cis-trans isomerase [Pseudobdellovibrionaceae bacterium]